MGGEQMNIKRKISQLPRKYEENSGEIVNQPSEVELNTEGTEITERINSALAASRPRCSIN